MTPKTVGCIFNVFESIPRLEAEETMCADKKLLLDPKPFKCRLGSKSSYTENPELELPPKFFYTCTAIPPCSNISTR